MSGRFNGRVVIVTGGGSGIGRGIVLRFARENAITCPIDSNESLVDRVAREIREIGGEVLPFHADATDAAVVTSSVKSVLERFGRIDVLVNNVGRSVVRPIMETQEANWEPMMRINVKAAFLWSRSVANHMAPLKRGCIINIASDLGKTADPYSGLYIAAKHAVIGLTKAMALELAPHGVRVNAICPGIVDTKLLSDYIDQLAARQNKSASVIRSEMITSIPLKRLATPDDVGGVVAFLASEDANYMTGQAINVTGGLLMV